MKRKLLMLVLAIPVTIFGFAQDDLSFEVVSVRPCRPDDPRGGLRPDPGGQRYVARCAALRGILWTVYRLHFDQLVGGPAWIDNDPFYIEGIAPRPSSIQELHVMMQRVLAERFKLQFHREKRGIEAYVLGLDKSGPKNLRDHPPESASDVAIDQKRDGSQEVWTARSSPMEFFAWRLGGRLGRPVVDETGLRAAGYDFELTFANIPPPRVTGDIQNPAFGPPTPTLPESSGPDIFEALRDQLGLRLDARKAPVEVFVIDHVERPSQN